MSSCVLWPSALLRILSDVRTPEKEELACGTAKVGFYFVKEILFKVAQNHVPAFERAHIAWLLQVLCSVDKHESAS